MSNNNLSSYSIRLVTVSLILWVGIGIFGLSYYQKYRESIKKVNEEELSAIADLKVRQIVKWREERIEDAKVISKTPFIASYVQMLINSQKDMKLKREILTWMKYLKEAYDNKSVLVLDSKGRKLLSVGETGDISETTPIALEPMVKKEIEFIDFHRDESSRDVELDISIPILTSEGKNSRLVGMFLLIIDPHKFLYPLIQSWPTASPTAETYLIRREGNEVVFLNELRHRKNTALSLRLPISKQGLPAAMVAGGKEGLREGVDYRGRKVFAALRSIPNSPWFLVSKVDAEEVFAPVGKRVWIFVAGMLILIVLAVLGIGLLWNKKARMALGKAHDDLKKVSEDLKRSNEDLQQFAYAASHDLQEPLRGVVGFAQLLETRYKGKLDKKADEFISYIIDGTRRMQMLIKDLLEYSRASAQDTVFGPTNCSVALEQAIYNLRSAIAESGAKLTYDLLPTIMGDESQLSRLFQNLMSNAIKFRSQEPLKIHISANPKEDEWIFTMRDNGIGIDPKQSERIFLMFQRLHTRAEYSGTGIGLAICKKIVERHGGRIWVESEPGRGTTFYFTLPVLETARKD